MNETLSIADLLTPETAPGALATLETEITLRRERKVQACPGGLVPAPVGFLRVREDDGDALVELIGGGPDVEIALGRAGGRMAGSLEPRVLV